MTPLNTNITGSLGIKAGLNRETLEIDFEAGIPADAVTVAIRGDNGAGKSTLMNLAMVPWLNPPQLPGNIYDHFGPEGERILEWAHAGERYRSTIQYRNTGKTKSTKAYIHVEQAGEWQPVTLPDHTASDGKARTYSACLEHILGAQSVYYLSAFRAQNAPRLADYDDPKGLMRDLLHLDEPAALADKSAAVRLEIERAAGTLKTEVAALDEKAERLEMEAAEITAEEAAVPGLRTTLAEAVAAHTAAKAAHESAYADSLNADKQRAERAAVQKRIDGVRERLNVDINRLDAGTKTANASKTAAASTLAAALRDIETDQAANEATIDRLGQTMARAADIRTAGADIGRLDAERAGHERTGAEIEDRIERRGVAGLALTDILHTIDIVKRNGVALGQQYTDMTSRASLTKTALFGEKCTPCPLLSDAVKAA
ncbi:MAG: hypothetical protein DRJ64_08840, partial [Thermoprotei archaeon]